MKIILKSTQQLAAVAALMLVAAIPAAAQTELTIENDGLTLAAFASSEKNVLSTTIRIIGPDGFVFENRIEDSSVHWIPEGNLADGMYHWDAWTVTVESGAPERAVPPSPPASTDVQSGGQTGPAGGQSATRDEFLDPEKSNRQGSIPAERLYTDEFKNVKRRSGSFRVRDGWMEPIIDRDEGVTRESEPQAGVFGSIAGAVIDFVFPSAHAQDCPNPCNIESTGSTAEVNFHSDTDGTQVDFELEGNAPLRIFEFAEEGTFNGDGPVKLSIDAGANAMVLSAFGNLGLGTGSPSQDLHISSTIPDIRLEDTSEAQSWYVKNSNAGRFEIGESSGLSGAFVIKPGALQSSVAIAGGGNVGIGTDSPQRPLHVTGNAVRIEQTSSTWDLNPGSLGMWFNRATPSSTFGILKLQNDAPEDSIVATATGVGIGTDSPTAPIHVVRNDDTFEMITLDQVNNSVVQDRNMMQLNNNGGIRFQFDNDALATQWRFQAATGNRDVFEIAKVGTGAIELELDAGGNLTIDGALTQQSDVNSKRDIEPVDAGSVLEKLQQVSVSEWTYKADEDGVRHLGPMAQDFYSAFSLGDNETKIAPADMAGVALAAIQAQQRMIREYQMEVRNQKTQIDELRRELEGVERLEVRLEQMERRLPPQMVHRD